MLWIQLLHHKWKAAFHNVPSSPVRLIKLLEGISCKKRTGNDKAMYLLAGSDFLCNTHIIPVKNEEGVAMLFILNFDYMLDEGSSDSLEKLGQTTPPKSDHSE